MTESIKDNKTKHAGGRPVTFKLTESQLKQMDKMAFNACKHRTIAEVLGVCRETLRERYLPRLHKKAAEGRVALRESQRRMSKAIPVMAIFLGKNELGQADKQEISGAGGEPLQFNITITKTYKKDGAD